MWQRTGASTGDSIYDALDTAQASAASEAQLFAIRSELELALQGALLSYIEMVRETNFDVSGLLGDIHGTPEVEIPPADFNLGFVLAAVNATTSLDTVLHSGNISALGIQVGASSFAGAVTMASTLGVTGTITGPGSGITSLNASNISSGTIGSTYLPTTAVSPGSYTYSSLTVDSTGRITSASNGTCVTSVTAGTGISLSGSTGAVTITNSSPSDYRLKDNIVPIVAPSTRLMQLRPVRYNFLTTPDVTVDGFIAHEVQEVVPEAVIGVKDGPEFQTMNVSLLVPLLTATVQEQQVTIKSLVARIEALEQYASNH
jgi:hypothetical protein